MPIFVSRFSPERSLVGNFLAPRVRQNGNEETNPQTSTRRRGQTRSVEADRDRLELNQGQPAGNAQAAAQPRTTAVTPAAETQSARQPAAAEAESTAENAASSRASQAESARTNETGAAAGTLTVRARQAGLAVGRTLLGGATATEGEPDEAGLGNLVLAIRDQNRAAAEEADPGRLAALAAEIDEQAQAAAEEEAAATAAVEEAGAEEAAAQEAAAAAQPLPEPATRDVQEQELQRDLQTIASGLQADAAIEGRRNVQQTEQNVRQATEESRTTEVQDNQSEIRSLQAERRQLQQEAQQADRAIRQLQNRNARLQSGPNGSSTTGATLDLLAQ